MSSLNSRNLVVVTSKIERWKEPVAACINLAYTVLYLRASAWAFPVAAIGALMFARLCWNRKMLAEFGLWLFYIGFAVYGWFTASSSWPDAWHAPLWAHGASAAGIAVGAWFLAKALRHWGETESPFLDAFTTVGSLVATGWMLAFDPVNWWYWIVINLAAVVLYWRNGMKWGALLFALYALLALEGWFNWFTWL